MWTTSSRRVQASSILTEQPTIRSTSINIKQVGQQEIEPANQWTINARASKKGPFPVSEVRSAVTLQEHDNSDTNREKRPAIFGTESDNQDPHAAMTSHSSPGDYTKNSSCSGQEINKSVHTTTNPSLKKKKKDSPARTWTGRVQATSQPQQTSARNPPRSGRTIQEGRTLHYAAHSSNVISTTEGRNYFRRCRV